ncbi:MAG: porin family protein [Allosphingosinicella sp.]
MRSHVFAAAAALSLFATPAFAQDIATPFTGARVGVTVGTGGNNVIDFDGATVGVDAGYDFDMGGAVLGIGAEYQTDLGHDFLDVNESAILARAGAKVGTNALVYASGGYTHISSGATPFGNFGADGYRIGGGVEFALGKGSTSLKIEERYSDYGHGADAFQTVAGLSFRF